MAKPVTRTALTTANAIGVAERQRRALELRRDGATFGAIAAKLGFSDRGTARKAVCSALAEITSEPAAEVKKLELERLDAIYARAVGFAGDDALEPRDRIAALRVQLLTSERRSRLEGLDAPVKVQEVPVDKLAEAQLHAELAAELAKSDQRLAVAN